MENWFHPFQENTAVGLRAVLLGVELDVIHVELATKQKYERFAVAPMHAK